MQQDRERLLAGEATPTGSSHTKSNLSAYTSDKHSGHKGTLYFQQLYIGLASGVIVILENS